MLLTQHWISRRGAMLVVALAALMLAPAPATMAASHGRIAGLDPGLSTAGDGIAKVIVTGTSAIAAQVEAVGGHVTAPLEFVHGVAAEVRADQLRRLATLPGVRGITANRRTSFLDYSFDDSTTASLFTQTTQATQLWAEGNIGTGVGVAVLDTGVTPMPDLQGRLVHGPDLSGEGTTIDSFGHGTVMAGIIAGDGQDSRARSGGAYTGVAPGAHVIAVKVAGRNGVVDVSTVLQAMHWIDAYRAQFNIRVMNLSWGVSSTQDPAVDPLNYAVERLWRDGIVVVVAAGNSGPDAGTITKPGDDPAVITVGAFNGRGDVNPTNDNVPGWSSQGPTAAGLAKPDLVASGRAVVGLRSYGSYVEANNHKALVEPSYIKGSGTSQASAVVSGVIALLLATRPELTPDQVKDVLTATASPIPNEPTQAQGAGRVQVADAMAATPTAPAQPLPATGLGSLEASRGGMHVAADCDGVPTEIQGEIDVRCQPWDPAAWTASAWTGDAWTGISWKGSEWAGVSWKDVGWSEANWDGISWKDGTWTDESWQGSSWTGGNSETSPWTGVSWKGSSWSGISWKDTSWATDTFTSAGYDDEFLTAFWGTKPKPGKRLPGEVYTPRPVDKRKAQ